MEYIIGHLGGYTVLTNVKSDSGDTVFKGNTLPVPTKILTLSIYTMISKMQVVMIRKASTTNTVLTVFGQDMIQNGGRNGISLTAGFKWDIGCDKYKKHKKPI